jgi:phage/plasmid-like protein (TIGR03299 family)
MWHGEGMVLEDYPESWDEARVAAGLMWEPTTQPVYTLRHLADEDITAMGVALAEDVTAPDFHVVREATDGGRHDVLVAASGHQAVVRDDNAEVLAVPSSSYSLITHGDMGEIIEAVLEADSNVKFETAGSCRGGRQVWALAYLDEPYQVPGDESPTYPFLALLNAHDGSASCQLTYTDVRVVCWNTWNAAAEQGERAGTRYVFRHTGNTTEKIAEAKKALGQLREDSKATRQLFEQLAQVPVLDAQVKTFTELFLPSPRDVGEQCSDRVQANVEKARTTFERLYTQSPTTDGVRGSAYGLLQTATEYLDHVRGFKSRDSYMGRTLLKPEAMKAKALGLVRDVCALGA